MPGFAFPKVGRLGFTSPPSRINLSACSAVLCSAKTAKSPSRETSLPEAIAPRYLACTQFFVSLPLTTFGVGSLQRPGAMAPPRQVSWSAGTPQLPALLQGDSWLSRVPRLPLCAHAPFSDPGGVPIHSPVTRSGLLPSGTFRPSTFPRRFGVIPMSATIQISRLNSAACTLTPSGFGLPLLGLPADVITDLLARL